MSLDLELAFDGHRIRMVGYKRLIVVGWRENVFHYLPQVQFFETFDRLLLWLVQSVRA